MLANEYVRLKNQFIRKDLFNASYSYLVDLSGLGVKCILTDPRLMSSNPVEVDVCFQDVKVLSTNASGGTLSCGSRL